MEYENNQGWRRKLTNKRRNKRQQNPSNQKLFCLHLLNINNQIYCLFMLYLLRQRCSLLFKAKKQKLRIFIPLLYKLFQMTGLSSN